MRLDPATALISVLVPSLGGLATLQELERGRAMVVPSQVTLRGGARPRLRPTAGMSAS